MAKAGRQTVRPIAPGEVWASHDYQRCFDGFLVTVRGDVNRPIAYVDASGFNNLTTPEALGLAEKIAADPIVAGMEACIDLRRFGRIDSMEEMPGFLYGIWCKPPEEEEGSEWVQPCPFCPIRRAKLNRQFEDLMRADGARDPAPQKKAAAKRSAPASRKARRGAEALATAAK